MAAERIETPVRRSFWESSMVKWATWALCPPRVHAVLERMIFGLYPQYQQDGITIYADPKEGPVEQVYAYIVSARQLIERLDPARARRVRTFLPNIFVKEWIPTQYWPGTQTCCIQRKFLVSHSDASVACMLVHEAAHGRLHRRGIHASPRSLGRIEAACIRDQIGFLKLLPRDEYPTTDRLIEWLENHAAAGLGVNR
jgi:hypothetical protein